jgi:hypothetical protein
MDFKLSPFQIAHAIPALEKENGSTIGIQDDLRSRKGLDSPRRLVAIGAVTDHTDHRLSPDFEFDVPTFATSDHDDFSPLDFISSGTASRSPVATD